jgi:hypothetical protein
MKTRRLVTLCALLGGLFASGVSASADESKLSDLHTILNNTTISGYVDTTTGGQIQPPAIQPPAQQEQRGWWQAFLHWFGFHGR